MEKVVPTARVAFNRHELAGAFGDLGTVLPLIMGMIAVNQLDPGSTFIAFGLFEIATGILYGLPMPVQPLKAIATIMITTGARKELMYGAGLVLGLTMVFLSLSGLIARIAELIPLSVVRGIQFGLGLNLMLVAMGYMGKGGWTGWLLAAFGIAVVLLLGQERRVPPSLLLIGLGLFAAWLTGLEGQAILRGIGLTLPKLNLPGLKDVLEGALLLALPQIPLSIANSLIATSALVGDLFPGRGPLKIGKLGLTYGGMNLIAPLLGGVPICHGCGGLAGHYRFGARTGGAVIIIGGLYVILGGLFASGLDEVVRIFPFPILGVLLFFEGFSLLQLISQVAGRKDDLSVALLVGAIIVGIPYGYAVGMVAGTLLFHLLRRGRVAL